MKTCSKCNIPQDNSEFCKASNSADGLHAWCRKCKSKHHNAWAKNNRTKINIKQNITNNEFRQANPELAKTMDRARYQKSRISNPNGHTRHMLQSNIRSRQTYLELKAQYLEYKGRHCSNCGHKNECGAVFDFHHIDSKNKLFDIATAISIRTPLEDVKSELDKCIVVCRNCHAVITAKETEERHRIREQNKKT